MTTIINDVKLDFSDVLFVPQRSSWDTNDTLESRSKIELERTFTFKYSRHQLRVIPIIAANMDTVGTIPMANSLASFNMMTALHKFYGAGELRMHFISSSYTSFYTIGTSDDDWLKLSSIMCANDHGPKLICLDVANGYTEKFFSRIKRIRNQWGDNVVIMAGNVVSPEVTIEAIRAGADIVKVGIGSGSVCTTRKVAGVGYPQFSAVLECANAAHSQGAHICSDGGVVHIADVAKAFGAGADFVMCGGLFAGHDECGGEKVYPKNVEELSLIHI